jgi:hypothetical protein
MQIKKAQLGQCCWGTPKISEMLMKRRIHEKVKGVLVLSLTRAPDLEEGKIPVKDAMGNCCNGAVE